MTDKIYPVVPLHRPFANINADEYAKWYDVSINHPEEFWKDQANTFISWYEPWQSVLTGDFPTQDVRWFTGGKLNAAFNCLDRHLPHRKNQPALLWVGDSPNQYQSLTYFELHERVCQFANVLKNLGVKRGDRVCLYLPMIVEMIIAMLACARIGAIHSVVFAGFSAEGLKQRIIDANCSVLITANVSMRQQKIIPLKEQVDLALSSDETNVRQVIVVKRTEHETPWKTGRDFWYHNLISQAATTCDPAVMDAEDDLFILYTSGSTGKPKGILHSTAGYLVYAATTFRYVFNYQPGEIYWCTADIGWITGHTYTVYGPLTNGATIVLFEGVPHHPTPARYWEIIDQLQVNIFYTSPTAIRALRREGNEWVRKTTRKSLRLLGTVGEPINPEAWDWYYRVVGNKHCPVVDTWWQTETGGIMMTPLPGATPLKPGSASWPFFGVSVAVVDDKGQEVSTGQMGHLVINRPWPGMLKTIYGDRKRFVENYFQEFPGCFSTGDLALKDEDGYFWILGRGDDVLKVSGHRIGTQEVESALVAHPTVSEAAVVGVPDPIKGQHIYAFVTLKRGIDPTKLLRDELMKLVRDYIGPIAALHEIQWADGLPKTRSGKIMRRLLGKIARKDTKELGDLSTLADPSVLDKLIRERTFYK